MWYVRPCCALRTSDQHWQAFPYQRLQRQMAYNTAVLSAAMQSLVHNPFQLFSLLHGKSHLTVFRKVKIRLTGVGQILALSKLLLFDSKICSRRGGTAKDIWMLKFTERPNRITRSVQCPEPNTNQSLRSLMDFMELICACQVCNANRHV